MADNDSIKINQDQWRCRPSILQYTWSAVSVSNPCLHPTSRIMTLFLRCFAMSFIQDIRQRDPPWKAKERNPANEKGKTTAKSSTDIACFKERSGKVMEGVPNGELVDAVSLKKLPLYDQWSTLPVPAPKISVQWVLLFQQRRLHVSALLCVGVSTSHVEWDMPVRRQTLFVCVVDCWTALHTPSYPFANTIMIQ